MIACQGIGIDQCKSLRRCLPPGHLGQGWKCEGRSVPAAGAAGNEGCDRVLD
ncbi:hypothetical protein TI01_0571 [Lysobacter sp. A03]|nr:hypothetical protein TI01_0571 [Lysobacter sp. A03]